MACNEDTRVESLLHPGNIVIVGASARPDGWSERIFKNLQRGAYKGKIYLVNPRHQSLWGVACYPGLESLPEPPDQVIFLTRREHVSGMLHQAASLGARSAVVFSGGFGEEGSDLGKQLAVDLKRIAENSGIGLCGPNCLGYASYPLGGIALTERGSLPEGARGDGDAAVVAQSGGVSLAMNRELLARGVRMRYVVSSGNELVLTLEDWIEYFISDPSISVIGAFIETVKEPERFLKLCAVARARGKMLVACKLGTSSKAREAIVSHTGRVAGSARVFESLCSSVGAIVTRTLDELVDCMSVFRAGRLPQSARAAAVTVSGGLKGILLDAGERWGVEFPSLCQETLEQLRGFEGIGSTIGNPVDSGWATLSGRGTVVDCVRRVALDEGVDSVFVQGMAGSNIEEYERISAETGKLIVLLENGFVSRSDVESGWEGVRSAEKVGVCVSADRAVAALKRLALWGERGDGCHLDSDASDGSLDRDGWMREVGEKSPQVDRILGGAYLSETEGWLIDERQAKKIASAYGLRVPRAVLVRDAEAVAFSVENVGLPCVMKVTSPIVAHKAALGMVSGVLRSGDAAVREYYRLESVCLEVLPAGTPWGIWLEEAVLDGVECTVGLWRDEEFGVVMMFGAGGAMMEEYEDVGFSQPVKDRRSALNLIRQSRIGRMLLSHGVDGEVSGYDVDALVEGLVSIGRIGMEGFTALKSLDMNPVLVGRAGLGMCVLDAAASLKPRV